MPHVLLGPQDWIGCLVEHDLIVPPDLSADVIASFLPRSISAVTFDGKVYGVPYAVDTPLLFRNTRLVPDEPTTIEELTSQVAQLRRSGATRCGVALPVGPEGEPFLMYPFLTGAGGDTFLRDGSGRVRPEFSDVESRAMVAALECFRSLTSAQHGILTPARDVFEAIKMFVSGRAPYLVTCAFALADLRRSGIEYAVGPIPPASGPARGPAFVSVESFFLTRRGAENPIARDWIECYLTRKDVADAHYRSQPRPLALKSQLAAALAHDDDVRLAYELWKTGDLMPSGVQMVDYWRHLRVAENELIAGGSAPAVARRLARGLAGAPATGAAPRLFC
ncbi:extracellular solute-binding protein [Actinoplanes sp. NPDC023714]|uniref:sugar ABC transporter substrate-binding protein n=1 Tax=Actinoplanes sp. NPDC023714 TaxID=3154322 RepID=UPI0033C33D80